MARLEAGANELAAKLCDEVESVPQLIQRVPSGMPTQTSDVRPYTNGDTEATPAGSMLQSKVTRALLITAPQR